jgi:deoxyribonuclease V
MTDSNILIKNVEFSADFQNLDIESAIALQEKLRNRIVVQDDFGAIRTVAGVDIGFSTDGSTARAAIAVLSYPDLELVASTTLEAPVTFPYIPGLLAFREVPIALKALAQLSVQPDLLLCDGNGYIHPRRFGLACHLGLLSNIPSIGVAKTPYIGTHEPLEERRGSWQLLYDQQEPIGAALRTQDNVKPLYVSVGHRISLETALQFVLICSPRYRLPETTRWADHLSKGHLEVI